jgi:hypothetical protein
MRDLESAGGLVKVDLVGVAPGDVAVVLVCKGLGAALRCDLIHQVLVSIYDSRICPRSGPHLHTGNCLNLVPVIGKRRIVFGLLFDCRMPGTVRFRAVHCSGTDTATSAPELRP